MGLLIDTSVFIRIERSGEGLETLLDSVGDLPVFLAAISASELLHGVHRANTAVRRGRRERFVESIFSQVPILPFDMEIARVHSRLWADLSARGQMIGAHDLLIAATGVTHEHSVVTNNVREFGRVEDLDVVAWPRLDE
ncbi:MAG: type II toxin-antitoxin system VapC family toxin [bacterium]|nr:type II toxin-antitoxin system VapC family toxin [bacterium]